MIIVNTPHNPVGKVFTRAELEAIAGIAEDFNLLVMSDEVVSNNADNHRNQLLNDTIQYDCLVFDKKEHVRFATLPGMWDRTVTVGSAGSAFRLTLINHALSLPSIFLANYHCRSIRCHRLAYRLAYCTQVHHPADARCHHSYRFLFQLATAGGSSGWS